MARKHRRKIGRERTSQLKPFNWGMGEREKISKIKKEIASGKVTPKYLSEKPEPMFITERQEREKQIARLEKVVGAKERVERIASKVERFLGQRARFRQILKKQRRAVYYARPRKQIPYQPIFFKEGLIKSNNLLNSGGIKQNGS